MAKATRCPPTLDRLPLRDRETGQFTVVVETPKDSHNKFKYDPAAGALRLGAVLGEGLSFPLDFGFFPSTLGEDGDPLDVLVLMDNSVPPGCVVAARLIGVLEIRQKAEGARWQRNDRFFAVASNAHGFHGLHSLRDLRAHMLDEIEAFFAHYTGLEGKRLEVLARRGPKRAAKLLKAGSKAFGAAR